jgi:two-component system, cell cycle sensor histidine kinase and response regulator CckA
MDKTVLLVEDDKSVRHFTHMVLRICGWTVLEAADGQEAVALCHRHQGPIPLLVTDIHLPDMEGTEVARILLALQPEMSVLYLSGDLQETAVPAEAAFLQKPFTIAAFEDKIRDVLAARETLVTT